MTPQVAGLFRALDAMDKTEPGTPLRDAMQAQKLAEALIDCIGSLQSCASWIPHDSGGEIAREVVSAEIKRYTAVIAEYEASHA